MLKIFAIKDNMAETFNTPFFQPTQVQALRIFNTEINRAAADNLLYQHPQDFDLYELGEFDDGEGITAATSQLLATGKSAKKE